MTSTCCAPAARPRVFDEVYAPSTLGILLREFTFGHANQLAAVARAHLVALRGADRRCCPASSSACSWTSTRCCARSTATQKQGASFGHAKIASRALLRLGLSPQITTISTATAAPVIAEARLRSGKAGSGRARRRPGQPGHRHRPRLRGQRHDHAARRLGVRHQEGDRRLRRRRRRVLPGGDPKHSASARQSRPSTRPPTPRCTTPARSTTPTPGS